MQFKALQTQQQDDGQFSTHVVERSTDDLPAGELLIAVSYSCLNYKDALSAMGNPGVTRNFPHTPGVDAVGVVKESSSDDFTIGDEVIVTGNDFGMNTDGGLAEYIRVPAAWAIALPEGLSARQAMQLGTAGLTAGLSLAKIETMGASPEQGPVLVTGATGGVGCISTALLAAQGYHPVCSSGKAEQAEKLLALGAKQVIDRKQLADVSPKALLKPQWRHAIDCVGGDTLVHILKSLHPGGSVACSGLVSSPTLNATVFPFILRGINLLGIDSVAIDRSEKETLWKRFANEWSLTLAEEFCTEISLDETPAYLQRFSSGGIFGRILVKIQ